MHCASGHPRRPGYKTDRQVTIPFDLRAGDALGVKAPALIGTRECLCYDVQAHAAAFAGGHYLCGQGIVEGDVKGPIAIKAGGPLTIDHHLHIAVTTEAQSSLPLQRSLPQTLARVHRWHIQDLLTYACMGQATFGKKRVILL